MKRGCIMATHTVVTAAWVIALASTAGCVKPGYIPNTKVPDTGQNREIIAVVEAYRKAMESRDAAGVLALVHPTYQDNAGTPEGSDDVDFEGLKKLLSTRFQRATKVRYHIEYQGVRVQGRDAQVDAYIDATFVYEPDNGPPRWRRLTDFNRFRAIKDADRWRFVSGL
jgi:hypothetical protein